MRWGHDCSKVTDTPLGTQRFVWHRAWLPTKAFATKPVYTPLYGIETPRPCTIWVWLEPVVEMETWGKTNIGYRWSFRYRYVPTQAERKAHGH
jgi:hypothetical protein